MKLAFIYAGQGSQTVGMGKSLYDSYPAARPVFDNTEIDFDLKRVCWQGPAELLNRTEYTQPCMVAAAIAATCALAERGVRPDMAAGLSLGEYSALYAAGVFDQQTAITLTRIRGQAMEQTVKGMDGRMAAVLGLDRAALQKVCDEAGSLGVVQIANYNCPGQMVIGGEAAAVERAAALALEGGARRVVPLNVSGPFHTSLLEPAARKLAEALKGTELKNPHIPVIFNATAAPLKPGETVAELLTRQVMSPVYFEDSLRAMERAGIDTFIEIGPGRVLSGFVRKTCPSVRVLGVEDAESLEAAVAAINQTV